MLNSLLWELAPPTEVPSDGRGRQGGDIVVEHRGRCYYVVYRRVIMLSGPYSISACLADVRPVRVRLYHPFIHFHFCMSDRLTVQNKSRKHLQATFPAHCI